MYDLSSGVVKGLGAVLDIIFRVWSFMDSIIIFGNGSLLDWYIGITLLGFVVSLLYSSLVNSSRSRKEVSSSNDSKTDD